MKNIVLALFIFISVHTFAQNPFNNPTVQVNGQVYDCDTTSARFVRVVNRQNQLSNGQIEGYKLARIRFLPNGTDRWAVIKNSFSSLRLGQLKVSDKFFVISYFYNLDGTVKEIWFWLRKNTQITPAELEKVERNLKQVQMPVYNQNLSNVLYYVSSHTFEF